MSTQDVEIVELLEEECDFGTCYQPVVETPNGGRYRYTGTMQLTEETGRKQVEDFDPEGRKWEHVSGPEWIPSEGDPKDSDDTRTPVLGDWDESEMGVVEVDRSWRDGDKRRVKVEEVDGRLGEEVIEWHRVEELEGDLVEIGGNVFEIDGFGKTWGMHGERQRYMYVIVEHGELRGMDPDEGSEDREDVEGREHSKHEVSHGVDRQPKSRGRNTTGPGGCPECGGPTSVSGHPCDGCVDR